MGLLYLYLYLLITLAGNYTMDISCARYMNITTNSDQYGICENIMLIGSVPAGVQGQE